MCFKTKTSTNSNTTGTQNTQSNLFDDPNYQGFMTGFNNQFSAPNINSVEAPVNAWQTGAVTNQAGMMPGLSTAMNTANSVASTGLDPNRIQQFMSPYIQSVVNPTLEAQRIQNEQATSAIRGNAATRGALGNNTGQTAAYYAGVQPGQQAQIAGLYNQGFNQAGQLATQDIMSRLQGAGQVGNLTGVGTQANMGQFGMGETMRLADRQNMMDPFQLWTAGLSGQEVASRVAGQNTDTTGTMRGTTTQSPSVGQSIMGGLGLATNIFGSGGLFPMNNWFNSGGGYTGGGTWARDGGVIKGYNSGGSVSGMTPFQGGSTFADKVMAAHETVQKMRASGGRTDSDKGNPGRFATSRMEPLSVMNRPMEPYGALGPLLRMDDRMAPMRYVSDAEQNGQDSFMSPSQAGRMGRRGFDEGGSVLPEVMTPFGGFNASNTTAMGPAFAGNPFGQFMPGGADGSALPPETTGQMFEAGGDPWTSGDVMEAYNPNGPPRAPNAVSPPPFNPSAPVMDPEATVSAGSGRQGVEPMHPHQRFAAMLMAASGPQVLGGAGEALLKMHNQRIQEHEAQLRADQLAQQLAHQNATLGLSRDAHELNRAELAERERHNRRTEENRNQNRPETAFDVSNAQAAAKAAQEREAAVAASQDEVRRLDQMSTLLSNPNMPQGRFADWEVEGRRIASALLPGVNLEGVPEAEAFRTLSNKMALSMRSTANGEGMPGAMSDADRTFLLQSVPRLQNTPAGNRLIVNSMRDTAQYRAAANTEAARYIHERRSNRGLSEHMSAWMRAYPMERVVPGHAETRREAERVAQASPPAAATAPAASQPTAAQQAVGARRQLRDGTWVVKQADGSWLPETSASNLSDVGVAP